MPPERQPYLCGGRLIPLNKKDSGIRPLVVGEILRALVAKLALREVDHCLSVLQPLQVAVGGKGPVIQAAILTLKSWVQDLRSDEIILKVDIANAYNTISRDACLSGVAKFCPDLMRWARWCLNGSSKVFFGADVIDCETGVQQGDPLAPMLFSVGIHAVIEELLTVPELNEIWFLDDGVCRGKYEVVLKAFQIMKAKLADIGLTINSRKCEIYGPKSADPLPGFDGVPVVIDRDQWSYLGTPLCE